jgi:hypothetical protein
MNSQFKPLDRDRKYGIVLFLLTIVSFTVAYNTDGGVQGAFAFVGVASFVTIMVLMGKSVDANGGWDDPPASEGSSHEIVTPPPAENQHAARSLRGEFTPLDRWRKLGIVSLVLTFAGFAVAINTTGWVQVVSMVVGLLSFLSIFVLMGKSIDEQQSARRK